MWRKGIVCNSDAASERTVAGPGAGSAPHSIYGDEAPDFHPATGRTFL